MEYVFKIIYNILIYYPRSVNNCIRHDQNSETHEKLGIYNTENLYKNIENGKKKILLYVYYYLILIINYLSINF